MIPGDVFLAIRMMFIFFFRGGPPASDEAGLVGQALLPGPGFNCGDLAGRCRNWFAVR